MSVKLKIHLHPEPRLKLGGAALHEHHQHPQPPESIEYLRQIHVSPQEIQWRLSKGCNIADYG